jgi:hypothetical protein
MPNSISAERKFAFYSGTALMVIGGLLFASFFVTLFVSIGQPAIDAASPAARAGTGMLLLAAGAWIRTLGARGLAGSGLVLRPDQARDDLEPYSRMAGGMIKDALEEAELGVPRAQAVMVRCTACDKLNQEDAKFCQECGARL